LLCINVPIKFDIEVICDRCDSRIPANEIQYGSKERPLCSICVGQICKERQQRSNQKADSFRIS